MQKAFGTVRSRPGAAIQGATVTVYDGGTSNTATIYSDDGSTPISGAAITTDANGYWEFYAADVGTPGYDVEVTGSGITTKKVSDVRLHDPYDTNVPTPPTTETYVQLVDSVTAPSATVGLAKFYIEGNVPKVKIGDGTVFTLGGASVPWHLAVDTHSADNTGASDATTEMQACLTAAGAGGSNKAYFEAGTYKYSQLSIPEGVEIITDGRDRTFFKTTIALATAGADNYGTTSSIISADAGHATNLTTGCKIRGITFQRDTGDTNDDVCYIQMCNFDRSVFEDFEFTGGQTGKTYGFYAGDGGDGSWNATGGCPIVSMNTIRDCYYSGGSADAFFGSQDDSAILSRGNMIVHNRLIGMTDPIVISMGFYGTWTGPNMIDDYTNGIRDNGEGSVVIGNAMRDAVGSTAGVDLRGEAQKSAFNYYGAQVDTKWTQTTNADYVSVVGDGGSSDAGLTDSESGIAGCMPRSKILYLRFPAENLRGIYGDLWMQNSARVKHNNTTDNDSVIGIFDYAGDPNGNKTPDYIGQQCRDTNASPNVIYEAMGAGNTDWENITTSGEAHSIASHSDTTGTGAELDELTDGSETTLHSHA